MTGPWFLLGGSIVGALAVRSAPLAIAFGVLGVAGAAARRSWIAPAGVFLIGLGVVGIGAAAQQEPGAIEEIARRVPLCRFEGRVHEHAGSLGTLVSISRIECSDVTRQGDLGLAVVDGTRGDAGGLAEGTGRLVPLGRTGFDAGRRRIGADAALFPEEVHFLPPTSLVPAAAAGLRRGVTSAGASLGARRAALLAGLTIGDTSRIDPRTEERMRRAGLSHLVAVSGSNVAIVVGAAVLAVGRAGKFASVAVAAAALFIYTLTVGPEPSVLRASTMGAIGLVALGTGLRAEPMAALAFALSVVLAARPQMIHSVGLQLSAVATAGLILWASAIAERFVRLPRPIALGAGATIAANLAVAPLLLGTFGELSLVSPLANLFAMAAVPPATVLGLSSGALATVNAPLGGAAALLTEPFVAWILAVGDVFGAPSFAAIDAPRYLGAILGVPVAWAAVVSYRSRRDLAPALSYTARRA